MGPLGQLRYDLRQLVKHRTATNASKVNWFFRQSYGIYHKKNARNKNIVSHYTVKKSRAQHMVHCVAKVGNYGAMVDFLQDKERRLNNGTLLMKI